MVGSDFKHSQNGVSISRNPNVSDLVKMMWEYITPVGLEVMAFQHDHGQ